jgi:hypothetical protein
MPKMLCGCGATLRMGSIPSPIEWRMIADERFAEIEGQVDADAICRAATTLIRCPTCSRLHVFWDASSDRAAEYVPADESMRRVALRIREYREYCCGEGHAWTVAKRAADPERPDESRCPYGHPAVDCHREWPADEVQILIRPATTVPRDVDADLSGRRTYWLVLLDREDRELCTSSRTYSWDDAVQLAQRFRGMSAEHALDEWRRSAEGG